MSTKDRTTSVPMALEQSTTGWTPVSSPAGRKHRWRTKGRGLQKPLPRYSQILSGAYRGRLGIRIIPQLLEPILCSEVEQEVQDRAPRAYLDGCRRPSFQARRLLPGEGGCAKPAPLERLSSRRRRSSVPSCFGIRVICSMGLQRLKRAATATKRPPRKPAKSSIGHGRRTILQDPLPLSPNLLEKFPSSFRST
jgi:hypothetical protein